MRSKSRSALPLPAKRALKKLGDDLSLARRIRRISTAVMAERAMISTPTLRRAEKGDPSVSIGVYATLLFVLGMSKKLGDLVDPGQDHTGLQIEAESAPKRIVYEKVKNG